jgi:hypothetical protein
MTPSVVTRIAANRRTFLKGAGFAGIGLTFVR